MWLLIAKSAAITFQVLGFAACFWATGEFIKDNEARQAVFSLCAALGFLLSALVLGGAFQ